MIPNTRWPNDNLMPLAQVKNWFKQVPWNTFPLSQCEDNSSSKKTLYKRNVWQEGANCAEGCTPKHWCTYELITYGWINIPREVAAPGVKRQRLPGRKEAGGGPGSPSYPDLASPPPPGSCRETEQQAKEGTTIADADVLDFGIWILIKWASPSSPLSPSRRVASAKHAWCSFQSAHWRQNRRFTPAPVGAVSVGGQRWGDHSKVLM